MKKSRTVPEPRAVSVDDAGHMIGVSRRTVYQLITDGALASRKIGRRRLILVASIEALLRGEAA